LKKYYYNSMKQYIYLIKISISQWLILIFIISHSNSNAQYNLVNNPSFEDYSVCPSIFPKVYPANWYPAGKVQQNYINICGADACGIVPIFCCSGGYNYQYPKNGVASVVNFFIGGTIGLNFRHYQQTKLRDSLKANRCYLVNFYINSCAASNYACNNISALLTNAPIYVDTISKPYGVLPATPQIYNYNNPILWDTLNWVKVSGIYIAQGGEKYLTLGNFKNDSQTSYKTVSTQGFNTATYNIDDISVIPLDSMPLKADAGKDTSIANVGDSVFIGSLTNGLTGVKWYDASGNEITSKAGVPGFFAKPTASTFYVIEQMVCGYYSRDTVNVTVGTVPLKFINYSVSIPLLGGVRGGSIENTWQTANETNVSHFNIQRSTNGKDFKTIGKLAAQNKIANEYNFLDNELPTTTDQLTIHYRIESVDFDGRKQYTETRTLNLKHQTLNGVSIYPNPTNGIINIKLGLNKNETYLIKVTDIYGKIVTEKTTNEITTTLNINGAKGYYFVSIYNKVTGKQQVEKVLLQ